MGKRKIIIGNWKMKLSIAESIALGRAYVTELAESTAIDLVACPHYLALPQVNELLKDTPIKLGAQDVFWEEKGAYTGEVSPQLLEEAGCSHVIIGHSERRQYLEENYHMIHQKVRTVLADTKLIPIICIGETMQEREADKQDYVITDQLQQALGGIRLLGEQELIIAYEPIWAIGTGTVITPADAITMHEIIHASLVDLFGVDLVNNNIRTVYGGSVDAANAASFSTNGTIDGLLIGSASLQAGEFSAIARTLSYVV